MAKIDEKPVADLPIEVDVDGNSVAANTAVAEVDAVEAWADKLLAMQPGKDTPDTDVISTVQPAIAGNESNVNPIERTEASVEEITRTVESFAASAVAPVSVPSGSDVQNAPDIVVSKSEPSISATSAPVPSVERDTPLTIPPAPTYAGDSKPRRPKRSGSGAWTWIGLVVLALLALLAIVFLLPQAAPYRDGAIRLLGLQNSLGTYFIDPGVRPTPVKTIPITPIDDDEVIENVPETVRPAGKREERLSEDGIESAPEATIETPVAPVVDAPIVDEPIVDEPVADEPVVEPSAPAEAVDEPAASDVVEPAAPDVDVEAQAPVLEGPSAILYEEGSTAGENTLDAGAVRWSLIQEDIGTGAAEPVINGRMDIPGRSMVLLVTLKRNVDPALPASHLIELIFAVPDGFSGGAIADINRFVMKESEQSRGKTLSVCQPNWGTGCF